MAKRPNKCIVCGNKISKPFYNKTTNKVSVTCGPECAAEYRRRKYYYRSLTEEGKKKNEIYRARTILRHREDYPDYDIRWAKRILAEAGEPFPKRQSASK